MDKHINDRMWERPELYSAVLPSVLRQFSIGLNQAFIGMVMYAIAIAFLIVAQLMVVAILPAAMLVFGGFLVTIWSKRRCYSFSAPISGRMYVQLAYWLDFAAITAKITGLGSGLALPLSIVSAFCFVFFLNRLNALIQQQKLIVVGRLVTAAWGFGALVLTQVSLFPGALNNAAMLVVMLAALASVCFVGSVFAYMYLLKETANSVAGLANFLELEIAAESFVEVEN